MAKQSLPPAIIVVAILNFVAVAPGRGSVTVTEMGLKNSQSQTVPVALGSVSVAVQ